MGMGSLGKYDNENLGFVYCDSYSLAHNRDWRFVIAKKIFWNKSHTIYAMFVGDDHAGN